MRYIVMLIIGLLIAGCIPPNQSQLRMEMDLEQMKRRLAQLEIQKAEGEQSQVTGGVSSQRQLAELQAGLDNMRVEFHSVSGQFDDLRKSTSDLSQQMLLIKDELTLQIDSLSHRLEELETGRSATPVTPSAAAPPQTTPQTTPEQQYEAALGLILNATDFAAGRAQMEAFTRNYPNHDLHVNALYWTGEALFGEKNFELAILQFQEVISRHAGHSKAPDALYKQALAFNALGDAQNARATMRKLIDSYPGTNQAKAADQYLQN